MWIYVKAWSMTALAVALSPLILFYELWTEEPEGVGEIVMLVVLLVTLILYSFVGWWAAAIVYGVMVVIALAFAWLMERVFNEDSLMLS